MPSLSWARTGRFWFEAALFTRTKGELCAVMCVILLYRREQKSRWPLQGVVFEGVTEDELDVLLEEVPFLDKVGEGLPERTT